MKSGSGRVTAHDVVERRRLEMHALSEQELHDRLSALPPLPDSGASDPGWNLEASWEALCWLLALSDEAGQRRLPGLAFDLVGHAPLDDPWDLTDSLRRGVEASFPDRHALSEAMATLAHNDRAGARRWAVRELGLLAEQDRSPYLVQLAKEDAVAEIRAEAIGALGRLWIEISDEKRRTMERELTSILQTDPDQRVRLAARHLLEEVAPELASTTIEPPKPQFADPDWMGDTSGPDAAQAVRRIIRALVVGTLTNPKLRDYLASSGTELVMTPGQEVYPPREPAASADGSAPRWHASIPLWTAAEAGERTRTGLVAEIELRRASQNEVRAKLRDITRDPAAR
jgi:hypothetical protein